MRRYLVALCGHCKPYFKDDAILAKKGNAGSSRIQLFSFALEGDNLRTGPSEVEEEALAKVDSTSCGRHLLSLFSNSRGNEPKSRAIQSGGASSGRAQSCRR